MNHQNWNESTYGIGAPLTFVCGAIAGAVVALMFAPGAGRDTRAFLTQRGRGVAEKSRHLLNEHGATVSEAIVRGRDKAVAFGQQVGHVVERGKAGYGRVLRQRPDVPGDATKSVAEAARAL